MAETNPTDPLDLKRRGTVGTWRIVDYVASGGMGHVYLVANAIGAGNAKKAIKFLRAQWGSNPAVREAFVREGDILSELSHNHLLRVNQIGLDKDTDQLYMVMDYVVGPEGKPQSLQNIKVPAPESKVERWANQLAQALEYIHQQGVQHLDIKPGNILLDASESIRLTDFGIAKLLRAEGTPGTGVAAEQPAAAPPAPAPAAASEDFERTIVGSASDAAIDATSVGPVAASRLDMTMSSDGSAAIASSGTGRFHDSAQASSAQRAEFMSLKWAAPEQIAGQPCAEKTDIYSMGLVLYYLLTGRHRDADHRAPSARFGGFSRKWDIILLLCCETDPANRPTARQLQDLLSSNAKLVIEHRAIYNNFAFDFSRTKPLVAADVAELAALDAKRLDDPTIVQLGSGESTKKPSPGELAQMLKLGLDTLPREHPVRGLAQDPDAARRPSPDQVIELLKVDRTRWEWMPIKNLCSHPIAAKRPTAKQLLELLAVTRDQMLGPGIRSLFDDRQGKDWPDAQQVLAALAQLELANAREYAREHRYLEVDAECRAFLKHNPRNPEAEKLLAEAELWRREHESLKQAAVIGLRRPLAIGAGRHLGRLASMYPWDAWAKEQRPKLLSRRVRDGAIILAVFGVTSFGAWFGYARMHASIEKSVALKMGSASVERDLLRARLEAVREALRPLPSSASVQWTQATETPVEDMRALAEEVTRLKSGTTPSDASTDAVAEAVGKPKGSLTWEQAITEVRGLRLNSSEAKLALDRAKKALASDSLTLSELASGVEKLKKDLDAVPDMVGAALDRPKGSLTLDQAISEIGKLRTASTGSDQLAKDVESALKPVRSLLADNTLTLKTLEGAVKAQVLAATEAKKRGDDLSAKLSGVPDQIAVALAKPKGSLSLDQGIKEVENLRLSSSGTTQLNQTIEDALKPVRKALADDTLSLATLGAAVDKQAQSLAKAQADLATAQAALKPAQEAAAASEAKSKAADSRIAAVTTVLEKNLNLAGQGLSLEALAEKAHKTDPGTGGKAVIDSLKPLLGNDLTALNLASRVAGLQKDATDSKAEASKAATRVTQLTADLAQARTSVEPLQKAIAEAEAGLRAKLGIADTSVMLPQLVAKVGGAGSSAFASQLDALRAKTSDSFALWLAARAEEASKANKQSDADRLLATAQRAADGKLSWTIGGNTVSVASAQSRPADGVFAVTADRTSAWPELAGNSFSYDPKKNALVSAKPCVTPARLGITPQKDGLISPADLTPWAKYLPLQSQVRENGGYFITTDLDWGLLDNGNAKFSKQLTPKQRMPVTFLLCLPLAQ